MEEDAYSIFMSRSVLMGWSSASAGDGRSLLWGMNDAEIDLTEPGTSRVAWFKIAVPEGIGERANPVVSLLTCAGDTMSRVGETLLESVQVFLLPQGQKTDLGELVAGLNWFGICDPHARASIGIAIDGVGDSDPYHLASDMLSTLQRTNTGTFDFHSISVADATALSVPSDRTYETQVPVGGATIMLAATTPEWSLGAIGWVVALVAEVVRPAGAMPTPIAVRVYRA